MRIGVNPEKGRVTENHQYQHRVVVVCYIPNTTEDYYKESAVVLKKCLESLVATINPETTCITFLNNASIPEVDAMAKEMLANKALDKYVVYAENKGKVYAVVDEVRGVFEPYVTITDCDVLFMNHWEKAVFDVFANNSKAGVVSPLPLPNAAKYYNEHLFVRNFLFGKLKYGKFVNDKDLELFAKSIGNVNAFDRKNKKHSWREKQYIIKDTNAVVGAGHFVATYKAYIFRNQVEFPKLKFKNGYEEKFFDVLPSYYGLYRLSTLNTFVYHMGNTITQDELSFKCKVLDNNVDITKYKLRKVNEFNVVFYSFVFKILNRIYKF